MIKIKSEILNKLFFKELQQLIRKYNEIESSTQEVIESIMNHLDDEELGKYLLNNPSKLDEVVSTMKIRDIDVDVILFFIWYNSEIKDMSIENAIINYEILDINGYIEIEEYLIYRSDKYLKKYAKEALETMLDDEHIIDRLFDKEMIMDFWLNKTDKHEVMNEILENDDLEEVLDINPEYAFKISKGIEYKYSTVEY
ncbi:hypothetical protein [Clostridioides sp. ES-S-0190-01]|uniref:hypothetical protein n=1 Tax=Clostridioides sp. ES-S-0190-01 TaxID=2770787 RepID=UPI001D12D686|nr:hypothetical protein [Clostridioides sp. ES-S-0190-01]